MELAELWLRLTYEAADVIASIRSDFGNESEYKARERMESEVFADKRDLAYAVFQRCKAPVPIRLFAKLRALRYRVKVLFGDAECKLLDDLSGIRATIMARCRMMQRKSLEEERVKRAMAIILEGETEADGETPPDEMQNKVQTIVSSIEETCRKVLTHGG